MRIGRLEVRLRPRPHFSEPSPEAPAAKLDYTCNICGSEQRVPVACFDREAVSCFECDSNVRFRAIVHLVTGFVHGKGQVLARMPARKDIVGLGLSDWPGYARPFAEKFSYRNTRYDREPRLDITDPPDALHDSCDFLVSSDVFEHVLQPVQRAFDGAFRVLRSGGMLVLTVPYDARGQCVEHYPGATGYSVRARGKRTRITHPDGNYTAEQPIFHGGPGSTLEMRTMSLPGVLGRLRAAGFEEIRVRSESVLAFGVVHDSPHSLPITAIKPRPGTAQAGS